ncbi:MAG: HlyD family efflux transporter periplasmic adaptor subunit [Thermoguttaceae bacterium]|nr:HlyD family efflux transporter periplasmic adaptor subunit [Thermoguttaceae bacterium]MDW8038498.1 HlyD family efflux transporter periplasmic adaptor subunit [Thermoguttaceae bacterium]
MMKKMIVPLVVMGMLGGFLGVGEWLQQDAWGSEPPLQEEHSASQQKPDQPASEANPPDKSPSEPSSAEKPPQQPDSKESPKPAGEKPAAEVSAGKPAAEKPTEKPVEKVEKPAEKPTTITITPKPFKIEVSLDGYLEPRDAQEVVLKPQVWMDWEVVSAVKHGAQVRQGDALIQFESKKLTDAITDAKAELRAAEIALQLAQLDVQWAERVQPIDLALVERTQKRFTEDFDRFFKVKQPLDRKAADLLLRRAQHLLESEEEELRQLEKMYKADDLTEETEEFILKRQRFFVELAKFFYEEAQKEHEETLQLTFPRREEDLKTDAEIQRLRAERAKTSLPLLVQKAKADLEKAQLARAKAQERLDQLQADLALMTLKSPTDGIVYYGRLSAGRLSGPEAETLRKGDKVAPGRTLMTIVKPRPMVLVAEVPEEKFHAVRPGMQAKVEPKGLPEVKFSAVVADVDRVPVADGKFRARFTPALDKEADALMPGMACKLKLVPYVKSDAIVVPKSAIEQDPLDDEKAYVYLVVEGKEPQRQPVVRGRQKDNECEILSGLKPGDKILAEPPKKKDSAS